MDCVYNRTCNDWDMKEHSDGVLIDMAHTLHSEHRREMKDEI